MSGSRAKGRRVAKSELAEKRRLALRMHAERLGPRTIARVLGVGRSTVFGWLAAARVGALEFEPRKPSGRPPKLTDQQVARLYGLLFKDPRQLEFDFGLWTRLMVAELIQKTFGVSMSISAVGVLLRRRLGMSPQRPLYRAAEADPEAIQAWKTEAFPAIVARARKEKAQIWFCDESGVRSDFHSGTTWAPTGQTPVVVGAGRRVRVNMISAVNARGGLHFRLVDGGINSAVFIDYLKALLHDVGKPDGKIFLILDRHRIHRSHETLEYLATVADRLTLFYLPEYAPDLNPEEWVWNNVKTAGVGKASVLDKHQLRNAIHHAFTRLRTIPDIIRGFFNDPKLDYINNAINT